jgi:hypothetical protein
VKLKEVMMDWTYISDKRAKRNVDNFDGEIPSGTVTLEITIR